jgi:hypothetical protein
MDEDREGFVSSQHKLRQSLDCFAGEPGGHSKRRETVLPVPVERWASAFRRWVLSLLERN